jgi:predicted RNase H-like HicB family nuclease
MNLGINIPNARDRAMLFNMDKTLRYLVYAQDGAFVAQCLDVDVASEGDTEDEAVSNLNEALELRFEDGFDLVPETRAVRFGEVTIHA